MAKELTEESLMDEINKELEVSFNALAARVIKDLEERSAVWTGFYASSWMASPLPITHDDDIWAYNPWSKIKASTLTSKGWVRPEPKVKRRHSIPKFNIRQTMYIANTAEYTEIAFAKSPQITHYASYELNKVVDEIFTDRTRITWRANIE